MTVYIENMSFYTTEEQVYELFSRAGEIKKIIMGLDKNTKTPCGFCFVIQWGQGCSGGQVHDEYRTEYDPGRGGYGKLVQKELEAQHQLVDCGGGSLDSFQPAIPYGRHGGSYRHGRDYDLKRHHDDDHYAPEMSKRSADQDYRRNSDQETRMEKNPRFRESGESDDNEDADYRRRRR